MTLLDMPKGVVGDQNTKLTSPYIAGTDTTITVVDATVIPDATSSAPNLASVRMPNKSCLVTFSYTGKTGNTITGVTVVESDIPLGLTATYPAGSKVYWSMTKRLLDNIIDNVASGGGGGGTSDYTQLSNKPSINSVTLVGNKTSANLGLQAALVSGTNIKTINDQSVLGSGNIEIEGETDYTQLDNLPQVNSVTLTGNKSSEQLGIVINLTKAQYDALSESEKNSGKIFCTTDETESLSYDDLSDRPSINNVTLTGNRTSSALSLQDTLVSGTNIKTINNQAVLGRGNIQIDGVTDYEDLNNLPMINSVDLVGNKSSADLGLQSAITSTSKLSSDLITDTNKTNKFYHTHASTHALNGNDQITMDASQVTTGIFSADRIPSLAYQRMVTVADEAAKSRLTSDDVNVGDTVYVQDGSKLYIVSSITGKGTASEVINYVIYTAYVSWNSITGKPSTYAPSSHATSHTDGTDDIQTANTSQKGLLSSTDWNTFNSKQSALTFDSAPASASTNPVTSGGVYTAINNKVRSGTTAPSGTATVGDIYVQYTGA